MVGTNAHLTGGHNEEAGDEHESGTFAVGEGAGGEVPR